MLSSRQIVRACLSSPLVCIYWIPRFWHGCEFTKRLNCMVSCSWKRKWQCWTAVCFSGERTSYPPSSSGDDLYKSHIPSQMKSVASHRFPSRTDSEQIFSRSLEPVYPDRITPALCRKDADSDPMYMHQETRLQPVSLGLYPAILTAAHFNRSVPETPSLH